MSGLTFGLPAGERSWGDWELSADRSEVTECFHYLMLVSSGTGTRVMPALEGTVLGILTRVSTMLDLLFLSVFTMWNTSMMFCCWIISHTLQMAQKVPLRPPPFLNRGKGESDSFLGAAPAVVREGVAILAKGRKGAGKSPNPSHVPWFPGFEYPESAVTLSELQAAHSHNGGFALGDPGQFNQLDVSLVL